MRRLNRKKVVIALAVVTLISVFCYVATHLVQYLIYPRDYSEYVEKYSAEFDVPEYIVYSVIKVESGFDKDARSEKGACGLMQLMPDTYDWLTEMKGEAKKDIFSEEENIKYGTYYLSLLYKKYENWTHALCAYNAGMGNVDKWLEKEPFRIRFFETYDYVNKLEVAMDKYLSLYYE